MRTINKFISREYIVLSFLIILFVGVSIFPTFYHLWKAPIGTQFSQAYNFFPDYYQFISWMKDGANGYLGLTTRFGAEIYPRRLVDTFFPILGFIGSRLGLDLFSTFTIARILLGVLRLVIQYILIALLIKNSKKRLAVFALSLLFTGFWYADVVSHKIIPHIFLSDITNFDVLRRLTFLPHHSFSSIFVILFFIIFAKALEKNKKYLTALSGLLIIAASETNPAAILFMTVILCFAFIILFILFYRGNVFDLIIHFSIVALAIFVVSFYYKFYVFTVFPWNSFYQGELSGTRTWGLVDYLGGLGLALPFSLVGLWAKRKSLNRLFLLIVAWAFGPIAAFIIFKYIISSYIFLFRLFQAQQFVPLGLLAGMGIFYINEKIKKTSYIYYFNSSGVYLFTS